MADKTVPLWAVAINAVAGLAIAAVIAGQFLGGGDEGVEQQASAVESSETEQAATSEPASDEAAEKTPVTPALYGAVDRARIIGANDEPGNWMAHGRTYGEQRYSPLKQITSDNVRQLGLSWAYEMNTTRGLEATPIVVDGIIYTTGNWGVVHAIDGRTGQELWTYDPEVPGEWGRYACCDVVNRGVAVWKGKVYGASLDGRLFALDAKDGSKIWEVNTIPGPPYTITGAPRIVNDKVIIGNGGAEYGVRGYITAYDTATGEQLWRFYTVPGNPDDPVESPELEAAMPTWKGGRWWEVGGGGTVWDSMAYDPDLNLLYVGVGNGSPWTREIRSPGGGDNLYLGSILAIDPDTDRKSVV